MKDWEGLFCPDCFSYLYNPPLLNLWSWSPFSPGLLLYFIKYKSWFSAGCGWGTAFLLTPGGGCLAQNSWFKSLPGKEMMENGDWVTVLGCPQSRTMYYILKPICAAETVTDGSTYVVKETGANKGTDRLYTCSPQMTDVIGECGWPEGTVTDEQ